MERRPVTLAVRIAALVAMASQAYDLATDAVVVTQLSNVNGFCSSRSTADVGTVVPIRAATHADAGQEAPTVAMSGACSGDTGSDTFAIPYRVYDCPVASRDAGVCFPVNLTQVSPGLVPQARFFSSPNGSISSLSLFREVCDAWRVEVTDHVTTAAAAAATAVGNEQAFRVPDCTLCSVAWRSSLSGGVQNGAWFEYERSEWCRIEAASVAGVAKAGDGNGGFGARVAATHPCADWPTYLFPVSALIFVVSLVSAALSVAHDLVGCLGLRRDAGGAPVRDAAAAAAAAVHSRSASSPASSELASASSKPVVEAPKPEDDDSGMIKGSIGALLCFALQPCHRREGLEPYATAKSTILNALRVLLEDVPQNVIALWVFGNGGACLGNIGDFVPQAVIINSIAASALTALIAVVRAALSLRGMMRAEPATSGEAPQPIVQRATFAATALTALPAVGVLVSTGLLLISGDGVWLPGSNTGGVAYVFIYYAGGAAALAVIGSLLVFRGILP